jgi:hypothetical protein
MFNEWIPFFVDLARKPSIIQYDILQSNGMISVVNSYIPPTASFTVDRKSISVGQTVAFDASSSYDDMDSLSQLQCRWDYDGNGSWDTSWSTSKATSHCYNSRGTFYAVLEVKDTLGLTSIVTKSIHVGSQDAFKIVLTWALIREIWILIFGLLQSTEPLIMCITPQKDLPVQRRMYGLT